jgi:hypothetical protein
VGFPRLVLEQKKEQKKLFLCVLLCSKTAKPGFDLHPPSFSSSLAAPKDSEGGSGKFFPVHMLEQKKSGEKVVH